MANNKSAKKRILINERNRIENRYYKSSVRTLTKSFLTKLSDYQESKSPETKKELDQALGSIYSLIDKGTKRNVFHKNKAARKKAQLAAALKTA